MHFLCVPNRSGLIGFQKSFAGRAGPGRNKNFGLGRAWAAHLTPLDKMQVWQGCSNEKLSQNSKDFSALRAENMQNQEKIPFSETPKIYIFGGIWGKIKN